MWRWCVLAVVAGLGCDDGGEGGEGGAIPIGGEGGEGGQVQALTCDVDTRRGLLPDPPERFDCATPPETIVVGTTEMFMYEASHPAATGTEAFPCAKAEGAEFQAPDIPAEPCSIAGVRPWHTIKHEAAKTACESIGWRLCTGEELVRACGGDDQQAYAYGDMFEAGGCNVREAYNQGGDPLPREAPTGAFERCESPSGGFDLNGNLWEWTNDRDENDSRARTYQGAGWRTIAQRHQDINQQCGTTTLVRGFSAGGYANPDVGFRCCRRAE